jgi:sialidase-1
MTWSPVTLHDALIEPVCQGSLIRSGNTLVFSNPAAEKRTNMTVKVSKDDGKSWRELQTVHAGPSAYSNLVDLSSGRIGLLYERGTQAPYESIAWTTLSLKGRE